MKQTFLDLYLTRKKKWKKNTRNTYQKTRINQICEKYKAEYEKEVEENKQLPKVWNQRKRKFVVKSAKKGDFLARAVRELYPSLANCKNEENKFRNAIMVAKRDLESREN